VEYCSFTASVNLGENFFFVIVYTYIFTFTGKCCSCPEVEVGETLLCLPFILLKELWWKLTFNLVFPKYALARALPHWCSLASQWGDSMRNFSSGSARYKYPCTPNVFSTTVCIVSWQVQEFSVFSMPLCHQALHSLSTLWILLSLFPHWSDQPLDAVKFSALQHFSFRISSAYHPIK